MTDIRKILDEPLTINVELVEAIDTQGSIKRKAIESLVGKEMAHKHAQGAYNQPVWEA